jgi:RsiW-degrading membrane proteinase PrsW (M82 family)
MEPKSPSKASSIIITIVGGLLFLTGCIAIIGYLGLPIIGYFDDFLSPQLGQIAAIFLGLAVGGLALFHGIGSLLGRRSQPLKLPPFYFFLILFTITLCLGNLLLNFHISEAYLFPLIFALGAALPTIAVLTWSGRRLGWPTNWRDSSFSFVSGSTLSIFIAITLETLLPYFIYLLVLPLEFIAYSFSELAWGSPGFVERLFTSPLILVFLLVVAFQAPIPEEFAKSLGPVLMAKRIQNERSAFFLGLASGAGFAILENMLYEGLYASWSGWSWGGITALRAIGSVMHPLCTGIVVLALYRERERKPGWFGRLGRAYLIAVGLHTLWNGGFEALLYLTGIDYFAGLGPSISIYGLYIETLLVIYLLILSAGLWMLLRHILNDLSEDVQTDLVTHLVSRRALGVWAVVCVVVIVPIGAALGSAWGDIRAVVMGGF